MGARVQVTAISGGVGLGRLVSVGRGIRLPTASGAAAVTDPGVAARERAEGLRTLVERLERLDERLDTAARMLRRSGIGRVQGSVSRPAVLVGDAVSNAKPGGGVIPGSAARLRSSEEVNTTPTRFTSRGPTWNNASTAQITVDGTYTGTTDTTWTVQSGNQDRTVGGTQDLTFTVIDSGGATIGTFSAPGGSTSRLRSSQEVNTTPTSFISRGPTWSNLSTSQITVGGTYTGTTDTTWTVRAGSQTRTVGGLPPISFTVLDPSGATLGSFTVAGGTPVGTPVAMIQGLTLSLGAGVVVGNGSFTVNVSASTGTDVNPSKPLNGTRLNDPELEDAFAVSTGSFLVNGVSIAVNATDTLQQVLNRITASAADVTATYDPLTDEVVLERKTAGALPITLSGDTSGLLNALKLSAATLESGTDPTAPGTPIPMIEGLSLTLGAGTVLANSAFSVQVSASEDTDLNPSLPLNGTRLNDPELEDAFAVSTGSFSINGVSIAVNATDTLQQVLDRITASAAGVTATYDALADEVLLTRNAVGVLPITLADDTSGLLDALKLTDATLEPGTEPTTTTSTGDLATEPIGVFSAMSGVVAGSFSLNGVSVSLDPATDSLSDVVAAMRAAVPEISATLASDGSITLRHATALNLGSDTTGLLALLGLDGASASGTVRAAGSGLSAAGGRRISEALEAVSAAMLPVMVDFTGARAAGAPVRDARAALRDAIGDALGTTGAHRRSWGLSLGAAEAVAGGPLRSPFEIDVDQLRSALRRNPRTLSAALIGADRRSGLLGDLQQRVTQALDGARTALGAVGGSVLSRSI